MNEWINHPLFLQLDPIKQELIRNAAKQTKGKSGKSMAPLMLSIITSANKKGIRFTSDEFSLILNIIKDGKSDTEKKQIDNMVNMIIQMKKKS